MRLNQSIPAMIAMAVDKAEKNFNDLWNEQNFFDRIVQRLKMSKEHWKNLIMFHFVEGTLLIIQLKTIIVNYHPTSRVASRFIGSLLRLLGRA